MNCQIKYKKMKAGFSVIELVIVVTIFILFAGISQITFFDFQRKSNLEISANNVVEALRYAKSNAQQVQNDTKWGVKINGSNVIVFSGNSYDARNTAFDKEITLNGILTSGLSEIIFQKVTGETINTGTITLTLGSQTKNIVINEKGTITY